MFYVYTSWGCMVAAGVVVFAWAHHRPDAPPPGNPHLTEQADADRWACSGVVVLAVASCVLMTVHFTLPSQEQEMDRAWAHITNRTWAHITNRSLPGDHIPASGPYMRI